MNQLDETEKCLREFMKELVKPNMVDFIETCILSSGAKAKLLNEVGKQAGNHIFMLVFS